MKKHITIMIAGSIFASIAFAATMVSNNPAIAVTPLPLNEQHLQYSGIKITNTGTTSIPLIEVSSALITAGDVRWCQKGDSTCDYQSTCDLNQHVLSTTNCILWFKSESNHQLIESFPVSDTLIITVGNERKILNVTKAMNLFVTGTFDTAAGNVAVNNIAQWNTKDQWSGLSNGLRGQNEVYGKALAIYRGDLYVGGKFSFAGSVLAQNIAIWNGNTWSSPGEVDGNGINRFVVDNGFLFMGGEFSKAGNVESNSLIKWDGKNKMWSAFGTLKAGSRVDALASEGNILYAGGLSTADKSQIFGWDENSGALQETFPIPDIDINEILISDKTMYVGKSTAPYLVKWSNAKWVNISNSERSIDGPVTSIIKCAYSLCVGGYSSSNRFTSILFNGGWDVLRGGIDRPVHVLYAADDNTLFVGGEFGGGIAMLYDKWMVFEGGVTAKNNYAPVYDILVTSSLAITSPK